jgi:hypothetical protein
MKILDAAQTAAALPFERLIRVLRDAFVTGAEAPLRHRHDIAQSDGTTAALLLMPACPRSCDSDPRSTACALAPSLQPWVAAACKLWPGAIRLAATATRAERLTHGRYAA